MSDLKFDGFRIENRAKYISMVNLLLFIFFSIVSLSRLFAKSDILFGVLLLLVNMLFLVNIWLAKKKIYKLVIELTHILIIANLFFLMFFMPHIHYLEMFRSLTYIVCIILLSGFISYMTRQVVIYTFLMLTIFIIYVFLKVLPYVTPDVFLTFRTSMIACIITIILMFLISFFLNKITNTIFDDSENEKRLSEEKFKKLQDVINEANKGFKIGEDLMNFSSLNVLSIFNINEDLKKSKFKLDAFKEETGLLFENIKHIINSLSKVKEDVETQNNSIEETNEAIKNISVSINNISATTNDKKRSIDNLMLTINKQKNEIEKSKEAIKSIESSFNNVAQAINSILDISNKTNLLAINASIEASHSGEKGRGFAVVAGEIRKLSDQTNKQTKIIFEQINKNSDKIKAAMSVNHELSGVFEELFRESKEISGMINDIMDKISSINTNINDITKRSALMTETSSNTEKSVCLIVEDIDTTGDIVKRLDSFSNEIEDNIDEVLTNFTSINSITEKIDSIGKENIYQIDKLNKEIELVNKIV